MSCERAPCHVVLFTPGAGPDDGNVVVAVSEGADGDTAFEIGVRLAMGRSSARSGHDAAVWSRSRPELRDVAADSPGASEGSTLVACRSTTSTAPSNGEGSPLLVTGFAASGTDEGGPRVVVRSADDPERVGMDLHFTRLSAQVRVSTEHVAAKAAVKAAPGTP